MRHVVSSAVVLLAVAFLGGCAGAKATAKAPSMPETVTVSPHMSVAMDDDTARALLGEDDVAVGTTTITSAEMDLTPAEDSLPEDRGSLADRPLVTWGVDPSAASSDLDGIPATRD